MLFKRKVVAILMFGIAFSLPTKATYPTFDGANLAEAITLNIESITTRLEREIQERAKRELEKLTTIKQENSGAAKDMAKIKAEQDLETASKNFDLAKEFKPIDVCKTVAEQKVSESIKKQAVNEYFGLSTNDDECVEVEKDPENVKIANDIADKYNNSPQDNKRKKDQVVSDLFKACMKDELLKEGVSSNQIQYANDIVRGSWCFDASLMGQGDLSVYDAGQYLAAREQVKILTDPVPDVNQSNSYNLNTKDGREVILKSLRGDMMMAVVQRVLYDYVNIKRPMNYYGDKTSNTVYLSQLQELEKFVLERYLDVDWIRKISNTHPDKNQAGGEDLSYSPEQVMREMAIIDGFLAHMSVLQYKSMLKQEMLQSLILSTRVNKLKN